MRKAIFSQNFELLAKELFKRIDQNSYQSFLNASVILVPDTNLKQRLLLSFVSEAKGKSIVGYKIQTLDSYLKSQSEELFSFFDMQCLIFDSLKKSTKKELSPFKNELVELSKELTPLFLSYGETKLQTQEPNWQREIYNEILEQKLFLTPEKLLKKRKDLFEGVHFFGFDVFPPYLRKALSSLQEVSLYLFSPCRQFWSDISSQSEQKRITKALLQQKQTVDALEEMEFFWLEAPPLLTSLGRLGKEFLKFLENAFFETEEVYEEVPPLSALKKLKINTLDFQGGEIEKDPSLTIHKTGSSHLSEIESLKEEILSLHQNGFAFSEMLVLAPEMERYLPYVEYCFSSSSIPYRFTNVNGVQKGLFQSFESLLILARNSWTKERVVHLFETGPFIDKLFLREGEKQKCINWIRKIFDFDLNWAHGFKKFFQESLFHYKAPSYESVSPNDLDLLEVLYETLSSLERDLSPLKESEFSLDIWAKTFDQLLEKYFLAKEEESLEFKMLVKQLYSVSEKLKGSYPLALVETLFQKRSKGSLRGNHLHAITFSPLKLGSIWPAKAVFVLGLDEERFPKKGQNSSLDLLKNEKEYNPGLSDLDKYALLQAFFAADEIFSLRYSHLSLDGKEKNPSPAIIELVKSAEMKTYPILNAQKEMKTLSFHSSEKKKNEAFQKIQISDLVLFAKNPWRYYVQKVLKISLKEKERVSLHRERGLLLRQSLSSPLTSVLSKQKNRFPQAIQRAFEKDVIFKHQEREAKLKGISGKIVSLQLLSASASKQKGIYPPLKLDLEEMCVELVGEVPFSLEKGAIHFGDDHLSSLIKAWPEILISLVVTNSDEIFFVQKEKIKKVIDPLEALKKYVSYYLRSKESLSPLMPEWADEILRKERKEFEFKTNFEDPYTSWVLQRIKEREDPSSWQWLRKSFSSLIELYPERKRV